MSNQRKIWELEDQIQSLRREADEALASQEKYSKAAQNSGGDSERQYKALRDQWSQKRDSLLSQARSLEGQLRSLKG